MIDQIDCRRATGDIADQNARSMAAISETLATPPVQVLLRAAARASLSASSIGEV